MSRFQFELATPADDTQLRRILADTPMDGDIRVSFRREPSYFRAAVVDGAFRQVVAARDRDTGRLVGFGCRSVSDRYANGKPAPVGYLSTLRLLEAYRNQGLVARGYRYFRQLHGDGRTPLYLTTIAEGNGAAERVLLSARASLPAYHFHGRFHTFVIPLAQGKPNGRASGVEIRRARGDDVPRIVEFLQTWGPNRQFFPCYQARDFFSADGALRDLRCEDLLLAFRDGRLVGTLGGWNQQHFRQSVVHAYSRRLRWTRPLFNVYASWRGLPRLPAAGERFCYLTAALPVVADDDPAVFAALLHSLTSSGDHGSADHLLVGLHERDPLVSVAQNHQVACYTTRLYLVCWDDGNTALAGLDGRVPYLELGSL
jgi:hypothetical protein